MMDVMGDLDSTVVRSVVVPFRSAVPCLGFRSVAPGVGAAAPCCAQ
jgi:hypothetical protein